jgi:cell division septal protein FtsQ
MRAQQRQDRIRGRRERRKLARQARVRRQILRYFLLALLVTIGISGFIYVPWSIANLNTDLIIQGNQVVSETQVRIALQECLDKPLYKINPQALSTQLCDLEAVRYAFVRRYLTPKPKLVVSILEEFPWASFATDPAAPNQEVIAESGRLIPISKFPAITQPQLRIFGQPNFQFTAKDVSQWASIAGYIAAQTGQKVCSIDLRNVNDIRVQDGDLYLKIGTNDSTLVRRLGRLASLMPTVSPFREKLEYIDLGLDNNIPFKVTKSDNAHP